MLLKINKIALFLLIGILSIAYSCSSYVSCGSNPLCKIGGGDENNNNNSVAGPTIIATSPINDAMGIAISGTVSATFSVAMNPSTINTTTFTLQNGITAITGAVAYSGTTATFTPSSDLTPNSTYIAAISTGAKDVSGNALAGNYAWVFTTARNYSAWMDTGIVYAAPVGSAYYPSVLYDANCFGTVPCNAGTPKYYMWYSNGAGSTFLVTSANGLLWNAPTTMLGLVNSHHVQVLYDVNCFGTVPCNIATSKYRMWFWDIGAPTPPYGIANLASAESADGINWINQQSATQDPSAKLVRDPDLGVGWNRGTYGPVSVFYQPSASNTGTEPWNYSYVLYYNGTDGSHEDTGLAYSTDGLYWSAYTVNPVLNGSGVGGAEAWDCGSATYGTVYKDPAGFHFLYSGRGQDDGMGGCTFPASFDGIGYAFSTDGKTWVKSTSNPIFYIGDGVPYRDERIYTPSIVNDGTGVLKMYYSAYGSSTGGVKKIGMAVQND